MDSNLEEEIAKLTEPSKTENNANGDRTYQRRHQGDGPGPNRGSGAPPTGGGVVPGSTAGGVSGMMGHPSNSHRRSPGSGELLRTGSGGQLRTNPASGRASPQRAAAVLAGHTISDLQAPVVPPTAATAREAQQYQQQQKQRGAPMHTRNSSNGRGSGKIAANGEKVAGFAPTAEAAATGAGAVPASSMTRSISAGSGVGTAAGRRRSGSGEVGKEEEVWKRSEEALKKKEQSVRNALKEKQRTLQQESRLLATVDRELAQLALAHQAEINELRKTLEVVDRELAFMDKDAQRKLEAFEKARTVLSAKVTQKQGITSRLTQLIMESEKQRDEKLNEIMKKMSTDAGVEGSRSSPGTTLPADGPGGLTRKGSGSSGSR